MKKIHVTQALLPNRKRFHQYVDKIIDSGWFTNRSQCVRELETRLQQYLGVRNVVLVANGTLALQLAYRTLDLHGEIITSPFTFIATASSAKWEGLEITFADILRDSWNIDPAEIETKISAQTSAIVPVHVFGNPCDVQAIDGLAKKHGLKVVYDAAHAFGIEYEKKSILSWGDISILSFHATKLFHTIEGGALIINDDELCAMVRKMLNFGITGQESIECLGINAKMNEFQAAMGLCLLDDIDAAIAQRATLTAKYNEILGGSVQKQAWHHQATNNFHYYPILLENESRAKAIQHALNKLDIYPRRYFYPPLHTLPFLSDIRQDAPISADIASRILCLPLFVDLDLKDCEQIAHVILSCINERP